MISSEALTSKKNCWRMTITRNKQKSNPLEIKLGSRKKLFVSLSSLSTISKKRRREELKIK
jgi:hypothetical protein